MITEQVPNATAVHWNSHYASLGCAHVSWHQDEPQPSLDLLLELDFAPRTPMVDVGGGASLLADRLLERGFKDITVVDISVTAVNGAVGRLGFIDGGSMLTSLSVRFRLADMRTWEPNRQYAIWHDRAAFHFLIDDAEVAAYTSKVRENLLPGGFAVFGTFAEDGPESFAGLPVRRYSTDALAAALAGCDGAAAFDVVKTLHHVHTTASGVPQAFSWVVARRRGFSTVASGD